jgi:tripartite-type tricarboxylate transporter receptor subunit TctC
MGGIDMKSFIFSIAFLAFAVPASAQNYPNHSVRVIVPYTAGGGTDTVGRAISQRLSEKWGQPVVVENRPGAGTSLGADMVAKAAPDGYTLLFSDSSSFVINPHIYEKLPFDPLKDLEPVALAVRLAPVLATTMNAPGKTVPELVAYAKANPGKLSYASPGVGSYPHVAMEYFKHLADVSILHVPYRGSTPALADLIAGRVTMYMVTYSVFDALEKEGKVRIVAAATQERLPSRPDLPAINESVKDYAINVWFGFAAPAGTPAPILDKIHNDIADILRQPQFIETFIKPQAYIAGNLSRADFTALIKSEHGKWAELVKISGARIQQ